MQDTSFSDLRRASEAVEAGAEIEDHLETTESTRHSSTGIMTSSSSIMTTWSWCRRRSKMRFGRI